MKKRIFLFILIFIGRNFTYAQEAEIDSLQKFITTAKDDSTKVKAILDLAKIYYGSDPQKSIRFAHLANDLAIKINYLKGSATALKSVGIGYYLQGKSFETLEYWERSLALFDSLGDQVGVANILSNEGAVYFNQGDDTKALDLYLQSLQVSEKLDDTLRIVSALSNIGGVYSNKELTWDKALEYYFRALPLMEAYSKQDERETKDALGTICINIGEIYFRQDTAYLEKNRIKKSYNDFQIDSIANESDSLSLFYFEKARNYFVDSEDLPAAMNWIGRIFARRNEFDKAVKYQNEAFEIAKKLETLLDMTQAKLGIGDTYFKQGAAKLAINSYKEAEKLAIEMGGTNLELKNTYGGLALSYAKLGDYKNAYNYQKLFTETKDKLYDIDTDKKLQGLQFTFDIQKKQGQIDLLTKDKALQELDLQRQKVIKNATIGGLSVVCIFLVVVFFQKKKITKEKQRSDELLLNILPSETAEELKATGKAKTKSFDLVSVMFTDFKNFTQASEKLSPEELVQEINYCYSAFDKIITKYGIEKIKTIGDSYMCAGGLPVSNSTHAIDVVQAGLEMQEFIAKNKAEREAKGQPFFELRLGVHTGPVVAGIVGIKKFAYDIWGDTVNTASRMESSGEVGRVNISGPTYEFIKDKFQCTHRGKVKAKNKGEIDMYFVDGNKN
ncbi:MAG: tetratricopeptide repeat protein [Bacteroidetes bacterium]|nr:MAG: tetratricopeptide repeat protein [Bacteroidota bacterium]